MLASNKMKFLYPILNLVAFVVYMISSIIQNSGAVGLPTMKEASDIATTVFTPASYTFAIWGVIYGLTCVFLVASFFQRVRDSPLIKIGVSWYFIAICTLESVWLYLFVLKLHNVALAIIIVAWLCAWRVYLGIFSVRYTLPTKSILEYFIVQLPFAIHAAWLTVATILSVNIAYTGGRETMSG
eukprot:GHVU01171306.1.p1 GENE.GHVU01171306.1~~GHVU01171306.1.p1  ORF type:complete len:184 (+),score=6.69 GHVU01171306.1:529-1080(+)